MSTPSPTPSAPAPSSIPSTSTTTTLPTVPTRPAALAGPSAGIANPAFNAGMGNYSSPYSSYGSSYSSPYNRFGSYSPYGMNNMYGGGYGGYGGSSYSPYGMSSMYPSPMGMGMPYGGMPSAPGLDPNAPPSLTQTLEATTAQTFGMLQALVQTFGGVAQMLESTFAATHASFFAMLGVVDQVSALRSALGSILGLFGLVRWLRDLLTGRAPASAPALNSEFRQFVNGVPPKPAGAPQQPRASRKPLIIFLLAVFGVPYAMHRLVRALIARQQAAVAAQGGGQLPPLDPSQLTFARALYLFEGAGPMELSLKENEIVAIMGKLDPATGAEVDPRLEVESEWWKGRTREGREGWFPRKWVQVLERRKPIDAPPPPAAAPVETKKVA
ncbi:Peroxisomal membrane protein [Sparassis crispa]|uniref:Peroxisomal membrane protein PEX13 n=1 Tax=Sparassis crispa TaxID=139825 RepID=A0A401GZL8_9APHY|nr:Peroxisomal membrane protein [Sparassis crispa]GBE87598.1 Peroxisomal membrane protein [Sparassis crispa]